MQVAERSEKRVHLGDSRDKHGVVASAKVEEPVSLFLIGHELASITQALVLFGKEFYRFVVNGSVGVAMEDYRWGLVRADVVVGRKGRW